MPACAAGLHLAKAESPATSGDCTKRKETPMSTDLVTGPSAGITGGESQHTWPRSFIDGSPGLAKALIQSGRHPRAGHDRKRWESVNWDDYRARVGICQRRGPWRVEMVQEKPGEPSQWVAEGDGLPFVPGWYTALIHEQRGLVMSDVPAEIAGMLPFLDRVQAENWKLRVTGTSVLISGLGLGIVPAWLLANVAVHRIDVIEIDADVIELVARDEAAREAWAASPRLHVHLGDALTWKPSGQPGCALHSDCEPPSSWDAAWHDIWDQPSSENLPSMRRLHRRFGRRAGWQMSWERPECEYRRKHPRSGSALCTISEDLGLEVPDGA
jgi:hypothetical protein